MVCCALISIVLAALVWPLRYLFRMVRPAKTPPLMWQLAGVENPQNAVPRFSISARLESVGYALSGLGFVIRNEHNARIHIATAIAVMALGTYFQISGSDWIILILAIISVLFAETINTAFEYLCDVVSPQKKRSRQTCQRYRGRGGSYNGHWCGYNRGNCLAAIYYKRIRI